MTVVGAAGRVGDAYGEVLNLASRSVDGGRAGAGEVRETTQTAAIAAMDRGL